jgi:ubiquinone/menaquinone biosynthesis C-methylase UbiE
MVKVPDQRLVDRVIGALAIRRGDKVLDVGSGTGFMIKFLLDADPEVVYACDLSQKMLGIIAEKYPNESRLQLMQADARHLPMADKTVDAVLCNGVYPHFESKPVALSELHRVTTPGGRLVISHFGGRHFVNSIHANSSDPVIRQDLIEPASEVAALLVTVGYEVTVCADEPDLFIVAGVKK